MAQRTGVPPDTLRSWERRYGFPEPSRTDTNRRLYSERDIAAIAWVRDQTERGQGTSEAIQMLLAWRPGDAAPVLAQPPASPEPRPVPRPAGIDALTAGLLAGRLDDAQRAWDRLALSASVEALCRNILLPAHRALEDAVTDGDLSGVAAKRAGAFLRRKATVLIDHAGPDRGEPAVCLVASAGTCGDVPELVLATALARAGLGAITPALDLAALDTIAAIRDLAPAWTVIVAGTDLDAARIAAFADLLPGQELSLWSPDGELALPGVPTSIERLPADPADAAQRLRKRG